MFVIDASVIANWCLPDESESTGETARRRLTTESAVAPALLWFELRNVLLTAERRGRLKQSQTISLFKEVGELPITLDGEPDGVLALTLARAHRLSLYDAVYLELAMRRSLPLATLDDALSRAAKAEKVPLIETR